MNYTCTRRKAWVLIVWHSVTDYIGYSHVLYQKGTLFLVLTNYALNPEVEETLSTLISARWSSAQQSGRCRPALQERAPPTPGRYLLPWPCNRSERGDELRNLYPCPESNIRHPARSCSFYCSLHTHGLLLGLHKN